MNTKRRKVNAAGLLAEGRHPLTRSELHPQAPTDRAGVGRRCGNCRFRQSVKSGSTRKPRCFRNGEDEAEKEWRTATAWWPGCGAHQWDAEEAIRMRISDVVIGNRARTDFGDLPSLVDSIKAVGLIQPIVVTANKELIAGHRRLKACQALGWDEIPSVVAERITDAVDRLVAERDENTCRKDMTVSEKLAIAARIEEMKRPEADARKRATQLAGREQGGAPVFGSSSAGGTEDSTSKRDRAQETAALAAEAIGMSRSTYYLVKAVKKYAEDPEQPDDIREAAREALDEMDGTGKFTPAYDRFVTRARELKLALRNKHKAEKAEPRPEAPPLTDKQGRRYPKRSQRKALTEGMAALSGLCDGFARVTELDDSINAEEAALWQRDLNQALRVLRSLNNTIKEHINGKH